MVIFWFIWILLQIGNAYKNSISIACSNGSRLTAWYNCSGVLEGVVVGRRNPEMLNCVKKCAESMQSAKNGTAIHFIYPRTMNVHHSEIKTKLELRNILECETRVQIIIWSYIDWNRGYYTVARRYIWILSSGGENNILRMSVANE